LHAAWPPPCAGNKALFDVDSRFPLFDKIVCPM
jgi:hypothetical protein